MEYEGDLKLKRSDDVVWRVIDNEVVLLTPNDVSLHALIGCGSRIWELIGEGIEFSDVVRCICEEYEVEPERACKDIIDFVKKLEAMHVIETMPAVTEGRRH